MKDTLSNRQVCFIIFSYIVGYGIISLPRDITQNMGTSGWLAIILGDILILISACLFIYLASNYNNQTLYEYSNLLVGKWLTYVFALIISIYGIFTAAMVARLTNATIKLTILINTPVWALSIVIFFIIFLALINPLSVLGKIFEIFSILVLLFSIPLYLGIFSQGKIINLKPFIMPVNLSDLPQLVPQVIFAFIGIEILAVIPLDTKKKNKKILRHVTYIILFIGAYYIFIIEACISVMGVDSIQHYQDALFATIRRIEINDLQVFRRLDSIFLIAWLLTIYSTIALSLYLAVALITKILKNINRTIIVFVLVVLTLFISFIPQDFQSAQKFLQYTSYLGLSVLFFIPAFLAILTWFNNHKYKKKKNH